MITNQSWNNYRNFSNTSILIYLCVEQAESSDISQILLVLFSIDHT